MFSHIKELFTRPSGYTISRSVRLRSSASGYFNRTPASASNRKTYTFSCWAKRGSLSSNQNIVAQGNNEVLFRFNTTDNINFADYTGGSAVWEITSSSVYRDPSAWYHIVFAIDTTQATSSNRVKVWINNSQVTFTGTYPTLNSDTPFNTTNAMLIGNRTGVSQYYDGYLTEINFIDGQALTPSSFGETDSITGVWKAKKYTGTYGTNGFYLNFSDNSSNTATTIGKDYSGNGNNWTPNNISVTSGATYDSMVDSPTVSAVSSNYCVGSPLNYRTTTPTPTVSDGNLKWIGPNAAISSIGCASMGASSGKWYWEATRVGATTGFIGVVNGQFNATTSSAFDLGYNANEYAYLSNASKTNNAVNTAYGASYTAGDVIGIALDLSAGTLTFYKNNVSQGTAYSSLPLGDYWTPAFDSYNGAGFTLNFGQQGFTYTPPTGFVALNTYNLPASTIKNGAAYMAATLYTGTGSAQNITNSGSFQPDFVWIKNRGGAYGHGLVDSVRGRASVLYSNDTAAQGTSGSTQDVTAFNSNGFALGTNSQIECNASGQSYIGWQWKAGGTSSSNTNGSITSSVSANTTAGFSVVSFTSPASGSFTVGHGLNAVPNLIITKPTSRSAGWVTYHSSLNGGNPGTSYFVYLNTTAGQASLASPPMWGSAVPTSSVFGASVSATCAPSEPLIAYCFAAVAGYSAFGSYTGNGSTDGPFVYTGFRPRWVMIKQATVSSRDWIILDTSRNTYNVADLQLLPNTTEAENTTFFSSTAYLDILSNGFKVRNASVRNNENTATYIYAAFAENPTKYALAR